MKPTSVLICLDLSPTDAGIVAYVADLARR